MRNESLKEQRQRIFAETLRETGIIKDNDVHLDPERFGTPRACGRTSWFEVECMGLTSAGRFFTLGSLRPPGGVASDPDAEVTSLDHFMATGQSWRPIQAWPDGADIQGGDL